ncbi:MAG: hypothetical protein AAFU64_02675 [Bacteroidota bacterium]
MKAGNFLQADLGKTYQKLYAFDAYPKRASEDACPRKGRQEEKLTRSALKVPVTRGVHSLEAVF